MAFQLSPGVNVTERDLTTIVPAVATTNAAFAGLFQWGPADQRILVDSVNNLISLYGLPDDNNYTFWFTAANFLGYGNSLTIARVTHPNAKNAVPQSGLTGVGGGVPREMYVPNDTYLDVDGGAGPDLGSDADTAWCAKYPGQLGNSIKLELCGGAASATSGGETMGTFETWSLSGQFNRKASTSAYAASIGGTADEFHLAVIDEDGLWTGERGSILETFEALSVLRGAVAADGTSIYYKDKINNESKYLACIDVDNTNALAGFTIGFTGGGSTGSAAFAANGEFGFTSGGLFVASLAGGTGAHGASAQANLFDAGKGYDLFSDAETFDCSLLLGGPIGTSTLSAATFGVLLKDIADDRKDCVAFMSAPNFNANVTEEVKKNTAITFRNAIGSSSYVVIDSGWKYQYDTYNDKYRYIPLNGDIAGLCVRTDITNDPWWSPAGFNRGQIRSVVKLAFNPSLSFRDELYKNNINPVVVFPGEGAVLYGDKTAQAKPSAFDRINVRRLFIVLEKAIATAAKYSLFEFNDSFTRAQFKSLVEPFLRDVQSRRGIIDFRVVCDDRNNTPQVIDSNRFVADIYIKPNRSINFIQLNFIATRTGVSFEEVGA